MTIKLDGKRVAAEVKANLAERVSTLKEHGIVPGLGTLLVGEDPGSMKYVAGKHADCAEVGIRSIRRDLPADASFDDIAAAVRDLNEDPACTGYIVQLPLPRGVDENAIIGLIDPSKDADGMHPYNLGELVLHVQGDITTPLPCTPRGVHGSGVVMSPCTCSTSSPRLYGCMPSASFEGSIRPMIAFSSTPRGSGSCTM